MDEEQIFLRAIELDQPHERFAFLDEACGPDRRLRANVESLLACHAAAGRFLEVPPADVQQTVAAGQGDTVENSSHSRVLESLAPSCKPGSIAQLGAYEIIEVIGSGGMGVVLRARDPKLNRDVAIKVLATSGAPSRDAVRRFVREAQAAAAVKHEHVVTIHAVHDEGPLPYIVLELVEGITLQQKIDRQGALQVDEILKIGSQIAAGLDAAHQRGLIHRDVKPANILLESGAERVRITDFGLARAVDDAQLSREGSIAGTPQFMSPEQAQGRKVDHRSDLFSLGSVLYTMCTGRPAFPAETAVAILRGICSDTPRPIREINDRIPEWLEGTVFRLLHKDPDRRPQTACEVAGRLDRELMHRQLAASPAFAESESIPRRRKLWMLTAAAAIVLAGVIIIIKSRDGTATRINAPDGANVTITPDGSVEVELPGGATRPQPNPRRPAAKRPARSQVAPDGWERSVSALAAQDQVAAVSDRLKQLNPGFDNRLTPTIENGVVTGLEFTADGITDLTPLRVLTKLRTLACNGSGTETPSGLDDLSPLSDLSLTSLSCERTKVSDLTPLEGMSLERLLCGDTLVQDLSPLQGMPLRFLACQSTRVIDLTPLRGMPLISLNCSHTPVADFLPLTGMKNLDALYIDGTTVKDLSPLKELPLRALNWRGYDYGAANYRDVVKSIETLAEINSQPASEFWASSEK